MHHDDIFGHDCLSHPVERECIVALMKLGMRVSGTLDNGLVISKDVADIMYRDTKVVYSQPEVNNLIGTSVGGKDDSL